MFSFRDRAGLPLVILVLGAALAGCGSSSNGVASESASEILAASRAAAQSASAVHLTSKSMSAGRSSRWTRAWPGKGSRAGLPPSDRP